MNNYDKFLDLRKKYDTFIYDKYEIIYDDEYMNIKYYFNIPGLTWFYPQIKINKKYILNSNINEEYLNSLVFHIGLIELVSYFKCTCSPNVVIKAGYINSDQIKWFKKLYFNGLGEFLYINNISITEDDLMTVTCDCKEVTLPKINYNGKGNLISVGGGKDSCVSLEILKNEKYLKTVIDIRDKQEVLKKPYKINNIKYYNIPLFGKQKHKQNKDSGKQKVSKIPNIFETYMEMVDSKIAKKQIKKILKIVMKQKNCCVLYHCTYGKDRTGIITLLILTMLDVDINIIKKDYLYSNIYLESIAEEKYKLYLEKTRDEDYAKQMKEIFLVKEEYIDHVINYINEKQGTIINYIEKEIGISKKEIEKFKNNFLITDK